MTHNFNIVPRNFTLPPVPSYNLNPIKHVNPHRGHAMTKLEVVLLLAALAVVVSITIEKIAREPCIADRLGDRYKTYYSLIGGVAITGLLCVSPTIGLVALGVLFFVTCLVNPKTSKWDNYQDCQPFAKLNAETEEAFIGDRAAFRHWAENQAYRMHAEYRRNAFVLEGFERQEAEFLAYMRQQEVGYRLQLLALELRNSQSPNLQI
jgi:hypothetical protein